MWKKTKHYNIADFVGKITKHYNHTNSRDYNIDDGKKRTKSHATILVTRVMPHFREGEKSN